MLTNGTQLSDTINSANCVVAMAISSPVLLSDRGRATGTHMGLGGKIKGRLTEQQ
jgi:hypothetical protein